MTQDPHTRPFLPFALPDIGEEEIAEVVDTLRSGWLTTGPKRGDSRRSSLRSSAAACSAIAAIPRRRRCTSRWRRSASGRATRSSRRRTRSPPRRRSCATSVPRPVFVDIEPHHAATSTRHAPSRAAITPRTEGAASRCISPASPATWRRCWTGAGARLAVVEDAAHALPARYKGRLIGTLGDVTVFSFYATKTITTGEGGMVVTRDEALLEPHARDAPARHQSRRLEALHGAEGSWYYEVVEPGFKYNMTGHRRRARHPSAARRR